MKIKIKITIEQLNNLIGFTAMYLKSSSSDFTISALNTVNLKAFIYFAAKKIITFSESSTPKNKLKTISFDVNLISAVEEALYYERTGLDPYLMALYIDISEQCRKKINLITLPLIEY